MQNLVDVIYLYDPIQLYGLYFKIYFWVASIQNIPQNKTCAKMLGLIQEKQHKWDFSHYLECVAEFKQIYSLTLNYGPNLKKKSKMPQKILKRKSKMLVFQIVDDKKLILEKNLK